jgi:flagellar protein FlgJ
MDPGNVSSLYLEDVRFAASSMGIGKNAADSGLKGPGLSKESGGLPSFAELLEKNYGKTEEAGPSPNPDPRTAVVDKTSQLYEQCEALETFLVKILLNGMRNTVQKSGLIDEGFAGKMYEDMLYDEYAKDFTKNAGFGLAELAYLELTGQRGKVISERA